MVLANYNSASFICIFDSGVAIEEGQDKTIAVHVRYKSLYIYLPSSAKQQREMTKFSR